MADLVGQTLSHYCVLEKIGSGGMGVVYRAHDQRLDRDVALKILKPGSLIDEPARKRFHKEATTFSKLSHSNIAHVYDFDSVDGTDFLVMEFVAGISLAQRIADGPLPENEVLALGLQIAQSLQAAHEQGIIHRDLKPGNIMVTSRGEVKLLDFGLAKFFKASATALTESLSEIRELSGTLPYMAPEHLQGFPTDMRSDIWAAGVVIFEMAAGQRPFPESQPARLIETILHSSPRPLAGLSPEFKRIVSKCLEKDPKYRYPSAQELAADLQRLQLGGSSTWLWAVVRGRASRRKFLAGGISSLLVVLLGTILARWKGLFLTPDAGIRSLAVLPLENNSKESEQDYFAQGMTDALINEMSKVSALRVISRTSVMQYKGTNKTIRQIAQELKVDAVLEGSVLRVGNEVRITAELIDARADRNLWGNSYEGELSDVLSLQSDVAQAVVREIKITLTPQEKVVFAKSQKIAPELYDTYLRGQFYLGERTPESLQKAVGQFQKAIALDPNYALAYAGLADGYGLLGLYDVYPVREILPKAKAAALKAVQLDDTLAEAYTALAWITWSLDWDWEGAEKFYQRAIQLSPSYASAHQFYALYLGSMGRRKESLSEIKRAQSQDPLSPIINSNVAWCYYLARDYESAIQQARSTLDLHPDFAVAHEYLGQAFAEESRTKEALAEFEKLGEESPTDPSAKSYAAYTYGRSGNSSQALANLRALEEQSKTKTVPAYYFAIGYAGLDDQTTALQWLQKSFGERDGHLVNLKVHPAFDRLRANPRFQQLLRSMNLQQ
jgi:serine/threonine protein kinase/tetratricopeptide (TPR) repeat protein